MFEELGDGKSWTSTNNLGLKKVPYQMLDVAEYLLIAENVERRGQAETDPIKKSRIAKFLQEYWNVREGSAGKRSLEGQNALQKTTSDIADMLGESERNTKRILKLHDLIPQRASSERQRALVIRLFYGEEQKDKMSLRYP